MEKECKCCKKIFIISSPKHPNQIFCNKKCNTSFNYKIWSIKNIEKEKLYQKNYQKENRNELNIYKQKWRKENLEKELISHRRSREKNREKINANKKLDRGNLDFNNSQTLALQLETLTNRLTKLQTQIQELNNV